ncbi:hypothetical protein [Sulfuracidifex metallicus]|uniref:hypothetical protein n=1 Tax=Sulfuracidifex metallicus TaxID=47303 RepID=UPI002276F4F3|nr:hypothetical protein [Sulfuracidifex metallicus]MCY0849694.1 hypothetical protein [Sulfuracidifex metallicus]
MEFSKDNSDITALIAVVISLVVSYKVNEEFPVLLLLTSLTGILGKKWVSAATILSSLGFLEFQLISPIQFVLVSIAVSISLILEVSYSVWLTMGVSLVVTSVEPVFQLLTLITLLVVMRYFKLEVKGFLVSGIAFLIISALVNLPVMDVSYFDLLTGVVGVVSENFNIPKRSPYLAPLIPALFFAAYGIPNGVYWADSTSFLFKYSPFSLWIPGSFYYPRVNDFLLCFFLDKPYYIFVLIMVYLSGVFSYHAFKSMGLKYPLPLSLVYSLLFPFNSPYIMVPYMVSPALLLLGKVKSDRKYLSVSLPLVALSSTTLIFPLVAYLLSSINRGLKWVNFLAFLGISAFWILPYALLGFPSEPTSQWSYLFLFAGIASLSIYLGGKRLPSFILLVSSIVIVLHLPFSSGFYPLVIISALYLANTVENFRALIVGTTLLLLLASQAGYAYSVYNAPSIHIPDLENGYVYWVGNYSLLSPLPLTNKTYANYVVNESAGQVNITKVLGKSPYFKVLEINYSSPVFLLPEDSTVQEFVDYVLWQVGNDSSLMISYPFYSSEKWVSVKTNESVNLEAQYQNGTFSSLKGEKFNLTSSLSFLKLVHRGEGEVINVSVEIYNGSLVRLGHFVGKPQCLVKPDFAGVVIDVNSSYPFLLKVNNISGLVFYLHGKQLSPMKTYLMKGHITLIGTFPGEKYLYVGLVVTLVSYVSVLMPWRRIMSITKDKEIGST